MQEARVVFYDCANRYSTVVDNDAWFMSLFKRAFHTHFTDLANLSTRESSATSFTDLQIEDDLILEGVVGSTSISYEFLELIEKAPAEVATVLSLLFNAPKEVLDLAHEAWRAAGKKKPEGNQFLCSMLGLDHTKMNLPKAVENYFIKGEWKPN